MSIEDMKAQFLSRYKSKQGTAIARKGWEACENAMKVQQEMLKAVRQKSKMEGLREKAFAAGLIVPKKKAN